jgi:hypothetical protein
MDKKKQSKGLKKFVEALGNIFGAIVFSNVNE